MLTRTWFITGVSSGFGRHLTEQLLDRGDRVIGTIRRERLDHVIVFNETSLRRILSSYLSYYHRSWTHLALDKDAPEARPVQPSDSGNVVAIPEVGGLHHRYSWREAA